MNIQYAMVFVSDMKGATAFFRDVLELPLRFESPGWTEFATEGATLALHATDASALEPTAGGAPAGTCRLGFNVADLTSFHERMQARQVDCIEEPTVRFGARLAQYSGPDGLVFSVGEARGAC